MPTSRIEAPAPPPHLYVALEWVIASGKLAALYAAEGNTLTEHCTAVAAAFQAALVAKGGPTGDTTVTEALLTELAAWLRALDATAYATLVQTAE